MSYNHNNDHGLADYKSWMEIPSGVVVTEGNNAQVSNRRFAKLVNIPGLTVNSNGSTDTNIVGLNINDDGSTNIKLQDGPNIDAFSRLRVSNPATIFDSKGIFKDPDLATNVENQPLFYDNQEISGGGTSTLYNLNQASTSLSVSNLTAGRRVRQTKRRFNYLPGKSQMYINTFVLGIQNDGITKREGYFDDNAGLFIELSDDLYLVVRTKTSGTVVDNKVAQSSWNLDKLDGTGASGITLDTTKTQILIIDFQWLGVGRVRFGFDINGQIIYVHQVMNANSIGVVYTQTPNCPIRTEIINDGTGPADTITQICSTIISEGGTHDTGIVRYASTNGTHVDAAVENTIYAVLGIRLRPTAVDQTVQLLSTSIVEVTGNKYYEWILLFNPTVADTFTYVAEAQSVVEIARGATANTVTGGHKISGGFASSDTKGGINIQTSSIISALVLGSFIDGTVDEIVLCVRPIGGSTNIDVEASLTWRELL